MDNTELLRTLKVAKYKILVAIRPLPQARLAFNLTLAEFRVYFRRLDEQMVKELTDLMFDLGKDE